MATLKKYTLEGREAGSVDLDDALIDTTANSQIIKDYIVALRANARQWSANTQTRAEVNHSGKKPHAQKGTGLARQGYLGAPHFRGGGRVFAPRPKFDQHVKINKQERRAVVRHLISEKIQNNCVHVLKCEDLEMPKTKVIDRFLQAIQLKGKRVLFLAESFVTTGKKNKQKMSHPANRYENFLKSIRNLQKVEFLFVPNMNGYDLMVSQSIVILEPAVDEVMMTLGGKK